MAQTSKGFQKEEEQEQEVTRISALAEDNAQPITCLSICLPPPKKIKIQLE